MSEILTNTGAKLWNKDDYGELWLDVFEQITGTGGNSNFRLIDEAIGKINKSLDGYYFKIINDRLCICKNTESGISSLPLSIIDDNGHTALKVDGSSITIDSSGIVHGATIDSVLSLDSENAIQNKVVTEKFNSVEGKIIANETAISSNTEALNTLNGDGEGSVKKTVTDEIAKVVADAPEDFDTLKEMSDWISSHESDASAMNSAIQKNTSDIATLQTDKVDKETGKSLLADTDKANYDDAVSKAHTHDNKSVLDGITSDKVAAWDNKSDFSGNYLDLNNKPTIPKGDGTTITMDEDGTLHGSSSVNEMTGATAEKDGTSGTVPAPLTGQEKLFLRGDGTWAEAKQDLSAYYNNANYDTENNKLQLMNGDTVLKEIEISGGGGTKISPKPTVNPSIINGNAKCKITWGDPDDVIADGVTLSTWKGTKLVMKETGYPENENDGTVIVDNKIKDTYVSTGYEVTGLTNGNTYYFKLFPYSTDGIYNYQDSNNLLGNPNLVKLDSCTNMNLSLAMGSVTVSWEDPNAEKTVDGNTATWAKTVLVYKQGSTAPSSVSDGIVAIEETTRNKYSANGFVVNGLTNGEQYSFALFAVSTEDVSSDATIATANLWATLIITTSETALYEKEVTATYGSSTVSGTFNSVGSATLQIPWIGETTIASTDGTDTATSKVTISSYETSYNKELSFLKIVTFADGTDEEILAMVQAHYNDKINIADYWAVGDTRNVALSSMSATGVGESHRAQTVQLVIGDFEHDDLVTSINGHTKAAITLLQKDCLMDASNATNPTNGSSNTENGYMNSSNINSGGWKSCARRTWCNNVYYNALPSVLKSMVKTVNKKVSVGNNSSTIETVQDKIFLAAEIEIFGSTTYSFAGEGTQYQYYKNATANRYKMPKWSSSSVSNLYWERSPCGGYTTNFCVVSNGGSASFDIASNAIGVAPCLCI